MADMKMHCSSVLTKILVQLLAMAQRKSLLPNQYRWEIYPWRKFQRCGAFISLLPIHRSNNEWSLEAHCAIGSIFRLFSAPSRNAAARAVWTIAYCIPNCKLINKVALANFTGFSQRGRRTNVLLKITVQNETTFNQIHIAGQYL